MLYSCLELCCFVCVICVDTPDLVCIYGCLAALILLLCCFLLFFWVFGWFIGLGFGYVFSLDDCCFYWCVWSSLIVLNGLFGCL